MSVKLITSFDYYDDILFMNKHFSIIITGPTGCGKSNFAVQLADALPIEIINADIGSFYTKFTIGTAKPDWKSSSIPHHFFDIIDDTSSFTAPDFREKLSTIMQDVWSRGNIPVIVGGSAFYIQSFFYKIYELQTPNVNIMRQLELQSAEVLWDELYHIDPVRALQINKHDHYRLVRALSIWHTENIKPSNFQPVFEPLSPFYFIHLTRDRNELYTMINQRVHTMIDQGWIEEVRSLSHDSAIKEFLYRKKMIGYDSLLDYLEHERIEDLSTTINTIAQSTRHYAKRQICFMKKLKQNVQSSIKNNQKYDSWAHFIDECNLTLCDLSLYINQLSYLILKK